MDVHFDFAVRQKVKLHPDGGAFYGEVRCLTYDADDVKSYSVRYLNGQRHLVTDWFRADELESNE